MHIKISLYGMVVLIEVSITLWQLRMIKIYPNLRIKGIDALVGVEFSCLSLSWEIPSHIIYKPLTWTW